MRTVSLLVMFALVVVACCQPPHGAAATLEAPPVPSAETLLGTWNGRWAAASGTSAQDDVELIVARVPGGGNLIGQFTFVVGGTSRTARYVGSLENGVLRFPLIGDGRIVLHAAPSPSPGSTLALEGEWVDRRGALPAPAGRIELRRVR
jgi:hypothetical protein